MQKALLPAGMAILLTASAAVGQTAVVSLLDAQHGAAKTLAEEVGSGSVGLGCAQLGIGPEGYLRTTPLSQTQCTTPAPQGWEVTATIESIGTENPLEGALARAVRAGQDTYLITPEGRVWFLDAFAATQSLLCGPACSP
ncbi:MAG: hypothetical protein AAFQ36_05360 [Pseudomonadota bacterium]